MVKTHLTHLLLTLGGLNMMATTAYSQVTFDFVRNNDGTDQRLNIIDNADGDWFGIHFDASTNTAVDLSNINPTTGPRFAASNLPGTNFPDAGSIGYIASTGGDAGDTFALFASLTSGLSAETISWYQASNDNVVTQILLRSGGQWYVSTDSWDQSDAVGGGAAELQDEPGAGDSLITLGFDGTASKWNVFDPTTDASPVGAIAGSDISSFITGIGFYVSGTTSGTSRFDHLVVSIPEPAYFAMACGLGVIAIVARKRYK